jgi:hypothetical protein
LQKHLESGLVRVEDHLRSKDLLIFGDIVFEDHPLGEADGNARTLIVLATVLNKPVTSISSKSI